MRITTITPTTALPGDLPVRAKLKTTVDEDDSVPFDLTIEVVLEDGKYVVEKLSATRKPGGPAITTKQLRLIPVGRIVAEGLVDVAKASLAVSITAGTALAASAIYRIAYACGLPPTKTVADVLACPVSTANKRVIQARKSGLLPATTAGRASAMMV